MNMHLQENFKLFFLISIALIFLSLNSIFCKVALVNNYIDAYSFTFLRLFFAAITLVFIYFLKHKEFSFSLSSNWLSSFMLFLYAIGFSYAYLDMEAGIGTLLLFAVVQIIMLASSIFFKEKISFQKILGISLAFSGLVYLLYPSETFTLSYAHVFLMILSAIGWAVYSILGKSSSDALFNTMDNFIKATIFVIVFFFVFFVDNLNISLNGVLLAFVSGSITSALGYVLWYKILPQIEIFTASVIQLIVPVLAIIISVLFLNELLTFSLLISTILISLGIALSVFKFKKKVNQNT